MTGISYVNETVNCVTGCTNLSPGCQNCYALAMSYRLWKMGDPKYNGVSYCGFSGEGVNWTGRINFYIEPLRRVLKWRKPKRIFLNSMSDTFHPGVTDEQIGEMWKIMFEAKQHTFLVLTKRPERMREVVGRVEWAKDLLSHIWLGVTVENQEMADERIPLLLQTPAAVRWLSVEPLLSKIDLTPFISYMAISLVILGCESGANRRECKIEWLRSLVAQCKAAGVPVWIKQLEINGRVEHDITRFPADLQVREVPNG